MAENKKRVWTDEQKKAAGKQARRNHRRGSQNQVKAAQMMNAMNVGAGGGADGVNAVFNFEFKSREKSAAHKFMDQAIANKSVGKIPAVLIHKNGDRRENDLICIRYKDWARVCKSECYTPPKKKRIKAEGKSYHV